MPEASSVAGFYDQLALDYHRIYPDWDASMARQGQALDAVIHAELGMDHATVLDCSCGIGTQAIALSRRGHQVTAPISARWPSPALFAKRLCEVPPCRLR